MTSLKTALACWFFLATGLTYDFLFGPMSATQYTGSLVVMYALALAVAAIVEGVALFLEWLVDRG